MRSTHVSRLNKAYGCLLGQCVGDALGAQVEFMTAREIKALKPEQTSEMLGLGPHKLSEGQITDDSEMALALARSILESKDYDREEVAKAYKAWLLSVKDMEVGGTIKAALTVPPGSNLAERMTRKAAQTQRATNGSLMRISPLGIWGWDKPSGFLSEFARAESSLTHSDKLCQEACDLFTHSIAFAINNDVTSGWTVYEEAMKFIKDSGEQFSVHVGKAVKDAHATLPFGADGPNKGSVLISLQVAYYSLAHLDDSTFESLTVNTIRMGGDTDTNAAIAGALIGVVVGAKAIPDRWVRAVLESPSGRPSLYHPRDLMEIAYKLTDLEK